MIITNKWIKFSTSKYNVLSFIPKFIFEQARKYSNIFFFLIVLLQVIELIKYLNFNKTSD
jgi:hypothetical protein